MLEPKKTIKLFYGGLVNIGRNINILSQNIKPFANIEEMASADVRLVDLECVIATTGEQHFTENHSYFRARPEQTNILTNANIDIVLTANDHSGDYGANALLEQAKFLDAAGILHCGSGKNFEDAFKPVYKKVGDITLAIFSVSTVLKTSGATADSPGTAYLPADNLELWKETFAKRIREAHEKAHLVIVAPHWGKYFEPNVSVESKNLAHLLIDLGADAVLGCHSYLVKGVENYKERPIIYDAGTLFMDLGRRNSGCFVLEISSDGVEKVRFIPLLTRPGQTVRAIKSAKGINKEFVAACAEFKTKSMTSKEDAVEINFTPPPREPKVIFDIAISNQKKYLFTPPAEPRVDWIVDKVPDEAVIPPKRFGPLKLVGYYVPPESQLLTKVKLLNVETYWTIDEPTDKSYLLSITARPTKECYVLPYGRGQEHEFCDYMWPTNRWKPGVIYREKIGLRPPDREKLANVPLRMEVAVLDGEEVLGKFRAPDLIKLKISGLKYPYWNTEFDEIIHHSEFGKCWTAEQLEKVTGGEWIVPPPEGFYIQSLPTISSPILTPPRLFLISNPESRAYLLKNIEKFAGVMVTRAIPGLPPDFPQLKVRSVGCAARELGFAARQRFRGKVIAVTGSAGKTTTCNMLSHVFGRDHNIMSSWGSSNMFGVVPRIFAHVKQDDAYAIIEMSINSFTKLPGSVTYDITPNVAIVTSIVPAHTGSGGNLKTLANFKKRVFCGMAQGDYAILNRDMPYYELFEQKAKSVKLNIITFGMHPDATIRLAALEDNTEFFIGEKSYKLSCSVPAEQLYDALAVVGASIAVGFSVERTLEYLKDFSPVQGRGNVIKSVRDGKSLTIINSTYNANPLSMKYALEHLKTSETNKKFRVAILGDIADLGKDTVNYHKGLAESMVAAETDRLLLCGKLMRHPYEMIKDKINVIYFETLAELLEKLDSYLQDGDTILIKSSHDTGLAKVVSFLIKSTPAPQEVVAPVENVQEAPVPQAVVAPVENVQEAPAPQAVVAPVENVQEAPAPQAVVAPVENVQEAPAPQAVVAPVENVQEAPAPQAVVAPVENVQEAPAPQALVAPVENVAETPAPQAVVAPVENVQEAPAPQAIVAPVENVQEAPAPQAVVAPVENVAETPAPQAIVAPVENVQEAPAPQAIVAPVENVAETPAPQAIVAPVENVAETPAPQAIVAPVLNIPKALFEVKDFLPEGIAPEDNGKIPANKLKRVHCGGKLYIDAARAWLAMVRAAALDNIFLNLNLSPNAYRKFEMQADIFKKRFVQVDAQIPLADDEIRVEFDNKTWQLKPKMNYAAVPGTSSHGYGLSVDIGNIKNKNVKAWLDKNAESFGFVKEYSFEPWHFTYIKSREEIPARVLEIESLPPEPTYSAEQIEEMSGCKWFVPPPKDWVCNGMFYARPPKVNCLAAIDQGQGIGISEEVAGTTFRQMAGFICTNPTPLLKFNRPLLVTTNLKETIAKLSALCH